MISKKHVILGFVLTAALLPIVYVILYIPEGNRTIKEEGGSQHQTGQDEASQKKDREKEKIGFIEPEGEGKHLIKGTKYEPEASKSPSKRWIEFVFFKRENGTLKKDGIYRWSINPINPDGSYADKNYASTAGAVEKIFRLRFGLTEKNGNDGVFVENQLHRFEFTKELNGSWYKERFRTPSIDSMKKGKIRRYPVLLNAYENQKQENKESDKREEKTLKNYRLKFTLTDIPEYKKGRSELLVAYKKDGEELFRKKYPRKDVKSRIEFTVQHKASSSEELLGGSLFVYSLSGKKVNEGFCVKWHLLCLKNNIQKKQLNCNNQDAFYRNEKEVVTGSINMSDYLKEEFNHKKDRLDKLYLIYPEERASFQEHPVSVVIKNGNCIDDLSQVEISAPKGRYHLKYRTKNKPDMKRAKMNFHWPQE